MTIPSRAPYQATPDLGLGPAYAKGNWYLTLEGLPVAGAAILATLTRLHPFRIRSLVDIVALGSRISTLAASGNCQFGIYRAHGTTLLPIGRPIANTGNIGTDTAVNVGGAIVQNRVQLVPSLYWFGVMADNATVIFQTTNNASHSNLVGGPTQDTISTATGNAAAHRSATSVFGTWPDLSDPALISLTNSAAWAMGQFQVAA